jgi:hypothetical protein
MTRARLFAAVLVAATVGVLPVVLGGAGPAGAAKGGGSASHFKATKVASFTFRSQHQQTSNKTSPSAPPHQPMNKTLHHTSAASVPHIPGTLIASGTGGAVGFNGLDGAQQLAAGTGPYANSQLDASPPDQGLCVGQGDVVETINLAVRVYGTDGTPLTAAVPLNQFVGAAPQATNGGAPFGPFLSDPRCYYDPDTGRWFLTVLAIALDPTTGAFGDSAWQYVAVSEASDPTGLWTIYSFSTTDDGTDGTPTDAGCPCFGDQPLIGADANGFYVATNEYSITGPAFNGAQLYAMSKTGLESGTNTAVTHLQPGADPSITSTLGGVAFSIEPAESPDSGYETGAGGTEYFQSSLDFGAAPALGTRADSIAVWALSNTSSLASASPSVSLNVTVVPTELYAQPPSSAQAPGTLITDSHLPRIETNDDRMMQVVYAGGHLWSGLNTAVTTPQGPTLSGIAWFATTPSVSDSGSVSAGLAGQGYLGVNKEDVFYPSIGVTPAGRAVMVFSLAGPDYHPSAAWTPLSLTTGTGPIYIAAAGTNADDDFSVLKAFGGDGVNSRWGDYSAAVSDTSGTVWIATEYISGLERTPSVNWATYVAQVTP